MLGVTDLRPTSVEDMYMPVPTEAGPSVISMAVLKPNREDVIPWRGPMLDRALVQMLSDFYWGDIDALFLDLPPGTGDMAISLGQHLPNAEVIVVTTPQEAAAEVAERAGAMAQMMHQRIVGVIENMAYLPCPHCGDEHRIEVFGSGGGDRVAEGLSLRLGTRVPVLGRIPLDLTLREGGDSGRPIVITDPDSPTAQAFTRIAASLKGKGRGLAGRMLNLTPVTGRLAVFGVGLPELAVIALVALLGVRPRQAPRVRPAGRPHGPSSCVSTPTAPATTFAASSARSTPTSS